MPLPPRTSPGPRADTRASRRTTGPRIGIALAGGGPLGAIYEIGALCALDESLIGLDLTGCHGYVGVSAGGFLAAGLANGISAREMCRAFIENVGPRDDLFDPAGLIRPARAEFQRRLRMLPGLLLQAGTRLAAGSTWMSAVEPLGGALPTGVLCSELLDRRLAELFAQPGRTNDFRRLRRKLVLVATDLDSGEAAPFGQPGWDEVPISKAVQASAALPGLFPPVDIGGRHYVDGALKKTVHATVLLDEGLDLLLCVNPLVPFDATHPLQQRLVTRGDDHIPRMVEGGLPVVLSQMFRSMIHSRLELGMKHYERSYPGTDIVLLEPDQRDAEMFLANTFSYSQRRRLAEHAYQRTRHWLRERADTLGPKLARHGISLDMAALLDAQRSLVRQRQRPRTRLARTLLRLETTLDELDRRLGPARAAPRALAWASDPAGPGKG